MNIDFFNIYTLILLILLFILFFFKKTFEKNKNFQKFIFCLIFLTFIVVQAIRYDVGTDYLYTYVPTYYKYLNNLSSVRMELAFELIYKFIIIFKLDYQWIFVLSSIIINIFMAKSINQISEDKLMSIFLYYCGTLFFFSMNGIRQSVAIVLFLYSLKYLENKNIKKYFILNIIGFLFHSSSIIYLFLYFLCNKKFNRKFMYITILTLFMSSTLFLPLIIKILSYTKYSIYVNGSTDYTATGALNLSSIINILIFIAYSLFIKKDSLTNRGNIYENIHFFGIVISIFLLYIPLANRLFIYFRHIFILSIPYLVVEIKKQSIINSQIVKVFIYVFFVAYFSYTVLYQNQNEVLPYLTFIERL